MKLICFVFHNVPSADVTNPVPKTYSRILLNIFILLVKVCLDIFLRSSEFLTSEEPSQLYSYGRRKKAHRILCGDVDVLNALRRKI